MNTNFRRAVHAVVLVALGTAVGYEVLPRIVALFEQDHGPRVSAHQTPACKEAIDRGYCDNPNKCTVLVNVAECGVAPTVVPDTLSVCEGASITWRLSSSGKAAGAKFATDTGIAFKPKAGRPDEFTKTKVKDEIFEHRNKHSKKDSDPAPEVFEYGIHILTRDVPNCVNFDPRVSNE